MVDAPSSATSSLPIHPVKPATADAATPDQASTAIAKNDRVQAWMPVMAATPQTAEAILGLPVGGMKPIE